MRGLRSRGVVLKMADPPGFREYVFHPTGHTLASTFSNLDCDIVGQVASRSDKTLMSRVTQRVMSVVLALFLLGAGTAQAFASAHALNCEALMQADMMTMPGMPGVDMGAQDHSEKSVPCKTTNDCLNQVCYGLNSAILASVSITTAHWTTSKLEPSSVSGTGLSVRPALPPPILVV